LAAIVLDVMAVVAWGLFVTDQWVREGGDQYARALITACDRLGAK
jgi:hypothetical protein